MKTKPEAKVVEMKSQAEVIRSEQPEYTLSETERKFFIELFGTRHQMEVQAQVEIQKVNLSINSALTLILHQHGLTECNYTLNNDATKLVPAPAPEAPPAPEEVKQ